MNELLRIENLHVSAGGRELLHGVDLTVRTGEAHVIMGVNGAGKSTLLHAVMGNPAYTVTEGRIYFNGEDITDLSVDKQARLGISFPSSPHLRGGHFCGKLHPHGQDGRLRAAAAALPF